MNTSRSALNDFPVNVSLGTALITIASGILVLTGWLLDIDIFKSVRPSLATMKVNTALSFVLLGMALYSLADAQSFYMTSPKVQHPRRVKIRYGIAWACSTLVLLIGLLTTVEYLFHVDLGIDQLLLQDFQVDGRHPPGRPSPVTAVSFCILALSLLILDYQTRNGYWLTQWLALFAGLLACLAIMGYIYGVKSLYGVYIFSTEAIHTAFLFLLLAVGILFAQASRGLIGIAFSHDAGGLIVRRLLPAALLISPLVGWLWLLGVRVGLFSFEFGFASFASSNVLVFLALVWWTGRSAQKMDIELRRTNDALKRSNTDLQHFAYIASHDLKTPLRSIAGFTELLQLTYAKKLDIQASDWLRRIDDAAEQLQRLTDDLLDYLRVATQPRPFERVSGHEVLDQTTSMLDAVIRESGAEITSSALPAVMGDRSQLVQLMFNLIDNALKYRSAVPPLVHVAAERKGDEWMFTVRDNGIGIAGRHHEQIFEIFGRLCDQHEYPGSGIGLAICRRVVNRHNGRIWVESELGQGSTFCFTIPERMENMPCKP